MHSGTEAPPEAQSLSQVALVNVEVGAVLASYESAAQTSVDLPFSL
jgi:hypothetical protein